MHGDGLGWSQFNQGKSLNAKRAFEKCVAIEPNHPAALNGLGWIAKGESNSDDAIGYYKKAVQAQPAATAALNGLATTLMELGRYDEALKYYEKWLKVEQTNSSAIAGRDKARKAINAVKGAVEVAHQWLSLVDRKEYGESWTHSAALFRTNITKDKWIPSVAAVRSPLGAVKSRRIKSSQFATSLPGAPDAAYVVIQYETSWEHKKSGVETITPMQDKDGKWRVAGYYVK